MKLFLLFLMFLLFPYLLFPTKIVPLPDVFNPESIVATDNEIYITSFPNIYIYSIKDFKLRKKMGKKGEGPQEFRRFTVLSVRPDDLVVGDRNKVLYFKRDGKYIKELNTKSIIYWGAVPLGDGFVAKSKLEENHIQFDTLNLYDSNLNKVKEVCRYRFFYQMSAGGRKCDAVEVRGIQCKVSDNRVFFKSGKDLVIDVFDKTGNKIRTIKHDYNRIKFSETHKERFRDYFKTTRPWKNMYEAQIKKEIFFPEYLPAIQTFIVADKKLYILTYEVKDGKSKFIILDFNGKFINAVWVPFEQSEQWFHYTLAKAIRHNSQAPTFSVNNGKLFQLVENEEEEQWELHITTLEK